MVNKEDEICFFSQDSRQMKNGGMYIPLKGERFDGHDFIESAFQTGATAIITAKDVSYPDKIVIKVEDTYQALKDMAISRVLVFPTLPVTPTTFTGR